MRLQKPKIFTICSFIEKLLVYQGGCQEFLLLLYQQATDTIKKREKKRIYFPTLCILVVPINIVGVQCDERQYSGTSKPTS